MRRSALFALALALIAPLSWGAPGFAEAGLDEVDHDDLGRKSADIDRAIAGGGVSPDRVVVVYDGPTSIGHADRVRVRARLGGQLLSADRALARDVLRVEGAAQAAAALARRLPGVRDAYPDRVATTRLAPNDPLFNPPNEMWGLRKIGMTTAWDTSQGKDVRVAILDCGIRATHEDLSGQVVLAQNFSSSNNLDDRCNHGTHVAGTVAALTNNGVGVASVAFAAKLLNVKVLNDRGSGFFSDIDRGIKWAADNGAKAINMSLGADIACPSGTQSAVDYAWARGSVLVAAAGNSGLMRAGAPANCREVIGVAATDRNDVDATWSNVGTDVDLAAPGVDIVSTVNPDVNNGQRYRSFNGTSMAAPHVAGVAALVWTTTYASGSTATAQATAVRDRIYATADRIAMTGTYYAHGRVNAANAVQGGALVTRDVAVTGLSAPSTVTQGTSAAVSVTVANQGGATENVTVTLSDTTAGTTIGTQTTTLAPGASATLSYTWTTGASTAPGDHVLRAEAAPVPGETNTANNSRTTTVRVTAHDVAVTSVSAPSPVAAGTTVTVTVDVANVGSFAETFAVRLEDTTGATPVAIGTPQTVSLTAGASTRLSFTWSVGTATGTRRLTATAATVTGELNTANNSMSTTVEVALRDAAVTSISASPTTVRQGQSTTIAVGVANNGTATETISVTVRDATANATIGTQSVTLAARTSTTLSFGWTTSLGTTVGDHTITARAAPLPGETSTADNERSTIVRVDAATRDVAVTAITPAQIVERGEEAEFTVTVANQGSVSETFSVTFRETAGRASFVPQTVTLAPGATANVTFTWNTTSHAAGGYTFEAEAVLAADQAPGNNKRSTTATVID